MKTGSIVMPFGGDEKTDSLTFSGRHINAMVNIDFETEILTGLSRIRKDGRKNIISTCLSRWAMVNSDGSMSNMPT